MEAIPDPDLSPPELPALVRCARCSDQPYLTHTVHTLHTLCRRKEERLRSPGSGALEWLKKWCRL